MHLELSVTWAVGLALAVARAGAFVGLCPLVPRTIAAPGRAALAIAMGLFVSAPVSSPSWGAAEVAAAAFTNVTVGAVLGWFLGLAFTAFQVAGTAVDVASGVTLGSVFDPDAGTTPGVFARIYTLAAQAIIIGAGGLMVLTQLLYASTKAIALDGRLGGLSLLGDAAVVRVSAVFRHGVELALPIVGVLFVAEIAFGMLSRLAPQVNMFLIALPVKTLAVLSMLGTAAALFPRVADNMLQSGTNTVLRLLGG